MTIVSSSPGHLGGHAHQLVGWVYTTVHVMFKQLLQTELGVELITLHHLSKLEIVQAPLAIR
jgi:hypothetical protein